MGLIQPAPVRERTPQEKHMGRTSITLGGVHLNSTVTNASGPRSATREELLELSGAHQGAVVFKSCNPKGLESPDNLKNPGVDYYASLARELAPKNTVVWGSVVGVTEDEIVDVARKLDQAGAKIIELNLADDFVANSVGPFKSHDRLRALLKRVRDAVKAVIAVKVPPSVKREEAGAIAGIFKETGVKVAVCANDLPKGLEFDLAKATVKAPSGALSQTHAFYQAGGGALDVVAVGGVGSGAEAYLAHLTGAKAVQVGSALIKEGVSAISRIDRELDALLAQNGKSSVSEIIGQVKFA
jgi:dihydroorotate dehydrogenase